MVFIEFSTENADYVLQGGYHKEFNRHNVFQDIDALVIETGNSTLENLIVFGHPQMWIAVDYCGRKEIPIYGADVKLTKSGNTRDEISTTVRWLTVLPLIYEFSKGKKLALSYNKIKDKDIKFYSIYHNLIQDPACAGRNAINAKKIEEFIVPKVKKDTGKKKPKIGLIYGASHLGLKHDLESKLRREITLFNWKYLNFGKFSGFDLKNLDKVNEARFSSYGWDFKEFDTGLFK